MENTVKRFVSNRGRWYVYNYREILNFIASGLIVIATDALLIIIDNSVSDSLFQLTFLDRYLVEAN